MGISNQTEQKMSNLQVNIPTSIETGRFTLENTVGFSQIECDEMNGQVALLIESGIEKSNAVATVFNQHFWRGEDFNALQSEGYGRDCI